LKIGTNIEHEYQINSTYNISQDNPTENTSFVKRILEAYFESQKYGKISMGHGSTASAGSSEIDYSGTTIVSCSASSFTNKGLKFRDRNDAYNLTDVQIKNVFDNLDDLSRRMRLRYDTPKSSQKKIRLCFYRSSKYDGRTNYTIHQFKA